MGRLVKTTPAAQEQQEEKRTVVGTGAHGRLVKTGDVQRTSPAANTAKTPTAQSVYQKVLDEAMMKRAAADQKNKERGRKSYNRTHAQEVREITGDKTKKSITPIIKSAAAGYAADMVGAADTLLRAPSGLNYAASQERGEIEASKKNIAAYTEKLKAAKTEEERPHWQTLIDRNKRLIEINSKAAGEQVKNYQDATKGAQETLQGTYQKLRKTASDNMEKANEGLTPVGKYLNNVGVAGAQMVADAALGGGSALGPMFLRVFGGNSQEAAEAADKPGMSAAEQLDAQNRALLYGTASGAVSIATEKISNVAAPFKKAFGGGFLDKAIDGAIAKMNGNAAGRLALSFLSEGGEEVIEDLVQPALQTIYNGKRAGQNYSELDAADILNDFLVGGALGLLGSGVEGVQRRSAQIETERAAVETKEATPSAEAMTPEETAPTVQQPVQQQNTMPAQPAVTPESAQGMGEGNLTPTQPNAAQGAAEGKADALDAGKRVALDKYTTQENVQQVSQKINDGTLAVDAEHNIYRVNEDQHIDRRDSASVGERSVNAFQFDHPELHSYYADAAAVLQEEMSFAQKGGELIRRTSREAGDDEYIRTKRGVSERIARLLDDEGVRYDDIDRSLSAIIHNHGQENFAAAKRVELLLDDMLTNGYTDIHGQHIAPNEEYIAAKKAIPGADMSERTHEELPIYDMPEGRNGGIDNAGQETRNDAAGAELADAGERGTPDEANAARALSDGAAERGERRGNRRESERIPREVRNVGGEDGNALTVQQRLAASGISQFISPREANVPNGASGDNTVTIFDEADWDQELIGAADWAKSKGVKKVTALLGVIKVEKDGKTGRIFGAFNADTGEIFVNAGSVQRSVSETIEHETAHYLAEVARRENVRTFMRDVQSRYSSEEWGKVYDAYFDRYAALTGDYAGMSESDIELYVWEEIMGDAYAEIDQYDEKASRFNREAESALSQSGQESESALHGERALGAVEQGRETAAATERRTGPPEKYSYAGRNAENADLDALHEAERYEMQGVDAETIRQKTGWFRGADGKWRSEVNDSGMKLRFESGLYDYDTELREKNRAWARLTDRKLTDEQRRDLADYQRSAERGDTDEALYEKLTGEFGGDFEKWALTLETTKEATKSIPNYTTLGKLVNAPELFTAYPDLADVGVTFQNLERGQNGGYNRRFDSIELSRDLKNRPEALLNSLIHEVQHAIQQREGFTPGANLKYWNRKLEEGYDGRDAETRREGARLREQYERMKANDPEFMRSMEELNAMAPTVPRGKVDMDTWEQVEPDPPEWARFDDRRDQLAEKSGDRVWDYFSLRDSIDRNARDGRLPGDLYRDTAGEIEARDAAARRGLTAEERRGRKPDTGDENTVFADGGESYSIANTRDMPWKDQVRGYFSNDGTIKSSDSLYLGESSVEGVDNAPMYIPTSVITKAIRPPKGSRSAHALSQKNILNLQEGIKNAPVVIDNPARNSIVYVTADQDSAGNYIIAALDKSNDLYGETAHKVTSIHGRENIAAMLEKLGDDATIFIKNENKLNRMLPGNQILKSLALRAKVELDDNSVSGHGENVKSPTLGDEIRRQIMGAEAESLPGEFGYKAERPKDYRLDDNVSDDGGNVKPKTRFSLEDETDSAGRELTMQQREYFKDSKVRDEDGRLIPVYHGSQAQFTEFSADFMSMHGSMEGQGFYFTDNRSMAEGYKRDGGQLLEGYLNISKPLSDSEVTMTKAELKKLLKAVDPTGDDVVINYDPTGGMGYPSKAWYNHALAATVEQIYSTSDSDSEILADVANSGAGAGATTKAARRALGYDGYIVKGKYDDATVYVAFESNQFKNADNKTPTENQDIRFSAGDDAALQRRRDRADAELDRTVDEDDLTAQNDAAEQLNRGRRDIADAEIADAEIAGQEWSYEKAEQDGKRGDYASIPAEWKTKLERARTAATNNIKPSGFDSYDAYLDALDKQRAADRAERLRVKSRDEFKGTKALDELGVKIANSAGIYHNAEQLIANDKAAKSIQNATKRAEQRLGATRQEKTIARDIANGERSMADIPRSVKKSRVLELVDYYTAQKATKTGLLQQQRIEINDALREQARELIGTEAPEINRKGLRKLFDPSKGLVLYHRTPQRIMRALFGWKQGQQINEAVFEPVYENEQERKRFINRMFDEARTFEGADGKKSALNKDESAFAQRLKEGRTVEELVEKSGAAESIRAAAENLKNGAEMKDAAREFSLDKGSRDLARQYADWLQTQDDYAAAKNVDRTKVENAIEKYTELYDKLYAAINDFLVAHGYEPIGFIKGYAPHFQTSEANGKLESALKAIGVDLGSGVGKLPTSIAGLTKSFKPNKRYNPFFQHRRGNETDYDIVKGFETYVDYASDVLYHTDDIMRVRQMANYLRSTFAPEEMKADIDQMEAMRYAPADVKEEYLRDKKKITGDTFLSYEDLTNLMEQYTDEKYRSIEDATEFSDLVSWMDDYANKLAGKQLFEDRAMEREVGREALNGAKNLNRMFARANVAGNLSSALNQTAQLPMIATELGQKYTWRAVGDILNGKTTGMSAFRGESDFLTEKSGIDYIQSTKGEKAIEKLFSPLEKVDTLVSTIAVRGKYRMELDAGKSPKEAMKAADRWARDIMGTRSKGSVPLTFQSKNLIAQMLNMFQVEAANTLEHVTQDRLGPGFKEMAAKIGKDKAIKKLASDAIAYMLLAFLLNRLDEDAYGGTPAPFDVIGMGLNAVASGNGLTSSDMLKMITDDVTENIFGERLFDTDPNDMNDEFDGWSAAEDTLYNISNDVPYVRNVAGLMGWGDQTLPMPDIVGAAGKTKDALKNADSAGEFWAEVAKQLVGLAGDTLPGGRQAEKMLQGGDAAIRGGSYQGFGDSKRLQYPVNSPLEDPFEALRAALFGKNALNESRVYWAEGGKALSAAQTVLYQELVDSGMSRKKAYETIRDFNDATADLEAYKDENGNPVSGSKKEKVVEAINKLPLSQKQKDKLYLSKNYSEKDLGEMPWN